MSSSIQKQKRIYYLDVLRAIACLAVVMIHTSSNYVVKDFGTINFWIGNFFDSLSRIGVPLFVMISGSLFLNENYKFDQRKLKEHFFKMIYFFVFWSVIYSAIFQIFGPLLQHESIRFGYVLGSIIKGNYHLWFIYMIIGLYLITPLLKLWIKIENKKYIQYFIVLTLIFTFVFPQTIKIGQCYSELFTYVNDILNDINIKYVGGFTIYFIMGWYIHNFSFKNPKLIYICAFLGFIISFIGTYILSVTTGEPIQLYDDLSINVFFQSISVYLFVFLKFKNIERENKYLINISKNSLGIYGIHACMVSVAYVVLSKLNFDIAIINIPIVFVCAFTSAYFGTSMMRKIRILNKFI